MKLWLKISLISIILVTLATGICSLIMLLRSGDSNLELAVSSALTDQQMRAQAWSSVMESETDGQSSAVARRSLARYLIDRFADANTILISGSDFIYNPTPIDPREFLPVEGDGQQYIIQDMDGASVLIAGSNLQINQTPYILYVVKDISSVYAGIRALAYQFVWINLAVIAAAGAGIIFLVRLVLRPVGTLKQNTGLIAAGIYDKRVEIIENDEIGELAENFNRMAEAVESRVCELREEADRRTMFMSALTHELKTPMTSISGNAQTLLMTKMEEDEREDALLRIDAECTRIERLSQKLMQLIVLRQNGGIRLEPHRVSGLLESVRLSCAEQLRQRGLKLKITNHMDTLMMDRDLLSSLLLNLIDNAGKSSGRGDTIEIIAKGNTIFVKDRGKGIPPDELSKITQPFYMVDKSRSRRAGGIGLGLALADEIARLHGARLAFESAPGQGTMVKVVFEGV
jgi:two-component system phosphate regulon sensor histidine kinase PhoR